MIDERQFQELTKARKLTLNVPALEREVYNDGKKALAPASAELRGLAQNLIDEITEHRHLKTAKILLLVEASDAQAKKIKKGEKIIAGLAGRANPLQRMLSADVRSESNGKTPKSDAEKKLDPILPGFDFIVKLNSNWLEKIGFHDGEEAAIRKVLALLDHELSHCNVQIAGKFVEQAKLFAFQGDLGDLHVETCHDIQDDKGRILVRFQVRDEQGRYAWKVRDHDIEEFCGVADRWGSWSRDLKQLVDVLVKPENVPLLEAAQGE